MAKRTWFQPLTSPSLILYIEFIYLYRHLIYYQILYCQLNPLNIWRNRPLLANFLLLSWPEPPSSLASLSALPPMAVLFLLLPVTFYSQHSSLVALMVPQPTEVKAQVLTRKHNALLRELSPSPQPHHTHTLFLCPYPCCILLVNYCLAILASLLFLKTTCTFSPEPIIT